MSGLKLVPDEVIGVLARHRYDQWAKRPMRTTQLEPWEDVREDYIVGARGSFEPIEPALAALAKSWATSPGFEGQVLDAIAAAFHPIEERWDPRGIEGYALGEVLGEIRDLLEKSGRSTQPRDSEHGEHRLLKRIPPTKGQEGR